MVDKFTAAEIVMPALHSAGAEAPLAYRVAHFCRVVGIGRTKFYELVARGEIPIRKIGKKSLVAAADLELWAEQLPTIAVKRRHASRTDLQTSRRA